jgi:hypothetical protein
MRIHFEHMPLLCCQHQHHTNPPNISATQEQTPQYVICVVYLSCSLRGKPWLDGTMQ